MDVHDLIAAGYKEHEVLVTSPHAEAFFQKTVYTDSDHKKAYFINVELYRTFLRDGTTEDAWEFSAQFFRKGDWFTVEFHEATSVLAVEEFYRDFYVRMGCEPDINNND